MRIKTYYEKYYSCNICLYKTQGDSSAALKLIQGIVRSNQDEQQKINVTWVIIVEDTNAGWPFYKSFIQLAKQIGVKVIYTDLRMCIDSNLAISNSDFLLHFPYIEESDLKSSIGFISSKKPELEIGEYNLPRKIGVVETGLGKGLGVFIEDGIDPNKDTQIPSEEIFLMNRIMGSTRVATPENVEQYKKEHMLFFGYFNADLDSSHNSFAVNPVNFFTICLQLAKLKKARKIDIIVRLENIHFLLKAIPRDDYSNVEIIGPDGKTHETHETFLNRDQSLPRLRIIIPFPISHSTFKLLASMAEKFIGDTGDQSLVQTIDLEALNFYQVMPWKQGLALAFENLCLSYLPAASELHEFTKLVLRQRQDQGTDLFCTKLANFIFYNESALLAQTKEIRKIIHRDYNLLENLIPRLRKVIFNPSLINEEFSLYMYKGEEIYEEEEQDTSKHCNPDLIIKKPCHIDKSIITYYLDQIIYKKITDQIINNVKKLQPG